MRVLVLATAAVALAFLGAGCAGKTTGAADVTRTAARLTAQGSCDRDCSYFFRFARTVDAGWPDRSPSLRSNTTAVRSGISSTNGTVVGFGDSTTVLLPSTTYRYQACGRDAGYSSYVCVGPDGGTGSSSTFTTPPGDYVVGSGYDIAETPALYLEVHATSGPSGEAPEGKVYFSVRGLGSRGGPVTCLRVEGSRAVIGTSDTFYFLEDGPGDQPGYLDRAGTNGQPGTCPPVRESSNGPKIAGFSIHDSAP